MRTGLLAFLALPLAAAPRLLLDGGDIERMRKLAAAEPWAARARDELAARAADWPASHVREFGLKEWALPKEGAGWSHAYVCPEHGMRLQQRSGKNLCPVDGKDYHGWPVDNVVYMHRNTDNARAVRDLGLAYQLTGESGYAAKARRVLAAYAELYPNLPIHDNKNKIDGRTGARIMSQTLSEAGWLVPLVAGYDLVRDTMSAAERERFETRVLREAARVIARYAAKKSNWQSWHNAALLAAGLELNDRELVRLAVDGPSGFRFQLRESITPDGPWYEGAWGYHFFALDPLLLTREMAVRAGIAAPEAPALKRMLDAPLSGVFPDGTLPNFNDSGMTKLAGYARVYETGYRVFGDPRYLAVLRKAPRGVDSLVRGAASLPEGEAPALRSEVLRDAGVATLRAPASDHTLAVKFGPHGGGHGHFDKLSFVSFAEGAHQGADPGTQAYAAPTHGTWDKSTIAHNTLVVDGRTQAEATGKLLDWMPREYGTTIRVSAGPAYPGVELERTLVHTAEFTLDIFDARATDGKAHTFDWMYHNYGAASTALALAPYAELPKTSGYQHLAKARAARTGGNWEAVFTQAESRLRLLMAGAPDTTVVLGEGLGPDLRVPVPFAMARRSGTSAHFVALYEASRNKGAVRGIRQAGLPRCYQTGCLSHCSGRGLSRRLHRSDRVQPAPSR